MISRSYLVQPLSLDTPIHGFYQHIHAGNGVFVRARRKGLYAIVPISDEGEDFCIPLEPVVELENKISESAIEQIYIDFVKSLPNERLAWVTSNIEVIFPAQLATPGMVKPLDEFDPLIENVLFDVHSHNTMEAYFSGQDNKDESKGFRVFIVIGKVGTLRPQIKARVGVFGHFMDVPISAVANIPSHLRLEDLYETAA